MSATVHAHNELPNGTPAQGVVVVTVNTDRQVIRDPAGNIVFQGPATIQLVDGEATFTLPGSNDGTLEPSGFTFTATEQLKHVARADYREVEFQTTNGATHHLADFAGSDEVAEDPSYGANLNGLTARVATLEEGGTGGGGPSLPTGGATGQTLIKSSGTDGDASWALVPRNSLAADVQSSLTKADSSVFRGGELGTIPADLSSLPAPVARYTGDTNGGAAGSAISAWTDDTGTTGSLVQATGGNQPKVGQADLLNGHKYVRFAGGNYYLSVARSLSTGTNYTIAFVGRASAGGFTVAIGDVVHSYNGRLVGPAQNQPGSAGVVASYGWAVYRVTVTTGGAWTLFRNGVAVGSGTGAGNLTTLNVGTNGGHDFYSDWDIAQIEVYSGNLVPEDGLRIDQTLGAKYALQIGQATGARSRVNTTLSGQTVSLSLPENRVAGQPLPLLIANHGGGGSADTFYDYPGPASTTDAALALGFAVLSSDLHGDSAGNATQLQDILDAITWAKTQASFSKVVLWGQSLGGLPTLNAIRKNTLASTGLQVVGALLIYPVIETLNGYYTSFHAQMISAFGLTNTTTQASSLAGATSLSLGVSYASGTKLAVGLGSFFEIVTVTGTPTGSGPYATPVTACAFAHGSGTGVSDSGTKVSDAGYNPSDAPASAYGNKRYRIYTSDADGVVDQAVNAIPFLTKISATAREAVRVPTRGAHGDVSNFNGRDQAQFLLRCLNDPVIV